jgi:FAD/FMN-containing dehydrogenase
MELDGIEELRGQVAGPVLPAGDPAAAEEASGFQLSVTHAPRVVVGATSEADIAAAVRWAAEHGLPVAVQATGHSPVLPAEGMLVTTGRMRGVSVDPQRRVATAEAGTRWADVVAVTAEHGLVPLSGSSSGVGVVGYTLTGGVGPLVRAHGFACDLVTRVRLVTADGAVTDVTANSDPELFWAVRGGKANFGIVTEVEFGLVPVSRLAGGGLYFDGADAEALLAAYRTWVPTLPEATTTSIALMRAPDLPFVPEPIRGRLSVRITVAHDGSLDEAESLVAPMLAAGSVVMGGLTDLAPTEFDRIHNDPTEPGASWDGGLLLGSLEEETVDALLAVAGPGVNPPITVVELRHLGGALGREPAVPSAAPGRDGAFGVFVIGVLAPPVADAVPGAGAAVLDALRPWALPTTLVAFAGAEASPEAVYGPDTLARLRRVKDRLDPDGLFRSGGDLRPTQEAVSAGG